MLTLHRVLSRSLRRGRATGAVSPAAEHQAGYGHPWVPGPGEWHPGFWLGLDLPSPRDRPKRREAFGELFRELFTKRGRDSARADLRRSGLEFQALTVTGPGHWAQFAEPDLLLTAAEGRVAVVYGDAGLLARERFQAWNRPHRHVGWQETPGPRGGLDLTGFLADAHEFLRGDVVNALLGLHRARGDEGTESGETTQARRRLTLLMGDAADHHASLKHLAQTIAAEDSALLSALGREMRTAEWQQAFGPGERLRDTLSVPGLLELGVAAAPLTAQRLTALMCHEDLRAAAAQQSAGHVPVPVTLYHQAWSLGAETFAVLHAAASQRGRGALSVYLAETPEPLIGAVCGDHPADGERLAVQRNLLNLHLRCTTPGHAVFERIGRAPSPADPRANTVHPVLPLLTPTVTQDRVEWRGRAVPNPLTMLL